LSWFKDFVLPALQGHKAGALAAVTPQLAAFAESFESHCWHMAAYCAMINAREQALAWLERAVRRGFINYPMLAEHDPFLQRLRGDAAFERLLERVKREWETLEL
jgi:non-specific serine/threonine protein kinase